MRPAVARHRRDLRNDDFFAVAAFVRNKSVCKFEAQLANDATDACVGKFHSQHTSCDHACAFERSNFGRQMAHGLNKSGRHISCVKAEFNTLREKKIADIQNMRRPLRRW